MLTRLHAQATVHPLRTAGDAYESSEHDGLHGMRTTTRGTDNADDGR